MFFLRRFQSLVFFLFVLDLLLLGAGVDIPGMNVSSRKLFFLLFGVASLLVYFGEFATRGSVDVVPMLAASLFLCVWAIFIPYFVHGNFAYAMSDVMPLAASGVFLFTADFPRWRNVWTDIRGMLLAFLYAFALLHVILYLILMVYPDLLLDLAETFALIFDVGVGDDARFVFFTPLDGGGARIYFGSSFLLLIGLYFLISDEGEYFGSGLRSWVVFAALLIGALWATNTRSLLLGAAAMLFLFPVSRWLMSRLRKSWLTLFLLLVLPFFLSFLLIPTVDTELLAFLGLGREGSDDVRSEQLYSLLNAFSEHWLFGLGFGANASFVRAEASPYAYELSILALFMKIGVVGILVACGIWASLLVSPQLGMEKASARKLSALYVLYFSFVVSCFYNPYIFGFFGTLFLLFVLYEFSFLAKDSK
ncbi:hypothetical protein [Acidovorax soli]|uniref:hypothetical protein n=1 Tax=Acidovorax soli TaxID=592050 RepID=UPI0032B2F4A4